MSAGAPPIRYADAQLVTRRALEALLADRPEPFAAGVEVGNRIPGERSDDTPRLPYVLVRTDGAFRNSRHDGRATVRVAVWHRDEGLALDLAALVEALLLAHRGGPIRNVRPITSPMPSSDPDTGDPLAFFRVTVRLRPEQITDLP